MYDPSDVSALREKCSSFNIRSGGLIEDSKRLKLIYERLGVDDYSLPKISQHTQLKEEFREKLRVTELLCQDCEKYQPRKKRE